jgi:hypothetical protein
MLNIVKIMTFDILIRHIGFFRIGVWDPGSDVEVLYVM